MEIIINKNNLDINKICFSECLSNKVINNGKHISINYKIDDKLTLTNILLITPDMNIPFEIKKYNNYDNKISKYYLDISFDNIDKNEEIKQFYNLINELDKYILDHIYQNQNKYSLYYKSKYDLEQNYISQIRKNPKKQHLLPTFKLKLSQINGGEISAKIYNKKVKIYDLNNIFFKNTNVKCIIKCNGIWIIGNKIGVTWKADVINIIEGPN